MRRPAKRPARRHARAARPSAPAAADWREAGAVDHVFTHFALTMRLHLRRRRSARPEGIWWPVERIGEAGLPTLFAKLAARGAGLAGEGKAGAALEGACRPEGALMRFAVLLLLALLLAVPARRAADACAGGTVEIAYGADPRQRLDFTPAATRAGAPLFLFIHGGAWAFGDKRMAGHMAAHFHAPRLCLRLAQLPARARRDAGAAGRGCRRGASPSWSRRGRLGIDPGRIIVIGPQRRRPSRRFGRHRSAPICAAHRPPDLGDRRHRPARRRRL